MKPNKLALDLIFYSLVGYAGAIGAITLYQRFEAWRLGGACPVPLQRPWTISAMVAAGLALAITLWQDHQKKRAGA